LADRGNWIRAAHPLHVLPVLHLHLHLLQEQHLVRHLDHHLILLVLQHPLQNQSGPVLLILLIPKFLDQVLLARLVLLVLLVHNISDSQSSHGLEPTKMKGSRRQAL